MPYPSHISTEEIAREPNVGVVGRRNDFFLCIELDERGDGAKRLFMGEQGGRGHVGEDGGRIERANAFGLCFVRGVTADEDAGTQGDGVIDVSYNFRDSAVMNEWSVCSARRSIFAI